MPSLPRLAELTAARTTGKNARVHITRCTGVDDHTSGHSCIHDQLPVDNSGHGCGRRYVHPSLGLLSSRRPALPVTSMIVHSEFPPNLEIRLKIFRAPPAQRAPVSLISNIH